LSNGLVDILVGTHALFEDKVIFNSLGMVVIDEAKNFVGSRLDIVITGALQTPTGRMVFGKLINNPESNKSFKSPATQG